MRNAKHYHRNDLLNFYAIYEAHNADNAKTFEIYLVTKLHEVYATNDFTTVKR